MVMMDNASCQLQEAFDSIVFYLLHGCFNRQFALEFMA